MRGGFHGRYGHRHHRPPPGMHRKMFWGFGMTIALTALIVYGVSWFIGGGDSWNRERDRAASLAAAQLLRVWPRPELRREVLGDIRRELHVEARLLDARGTLLEGEAWGCKWVAALPVVDGATLEICWDERRPSPWRAPLYLLPAALFLWVVAGRWARGLSRPLAELTRTARDFGEGKLDRRARLPAHYFREVGALAQAFNEMAARIERQLKTEKELLAGVSHELRSPLARIRLLVELGRERGRDVLGEIEAEAMEMDDLVGELLAVARLDFRALSLRPLAVASLAQRAVRRAAELAPDLPAVDLDVAEVEVNADATLLQRALNVLLDNARRHGRAPIALRITAHEERVVFEVTDGGQGFAEADLPRVFEPFYRGQGEAHDEAKGVGLGLAIVRRVAEAHGGTAWAKNLPEGGAAVGFDLKR
jgi:two-component system, OmpR family, sensor kinase